VHRPNSARGLALSARPKGQSGLAGLWRRRARSRRRHHAREWCGGAMMGGGTAAPAALSQRHEHEEKALGKVRVAGSH
jgi:hypothetical protein